MFSAASKQHVKLWSVQHMAIRAIMLLSGKMDFYMDVGQNGL